MLISSQTQTRILIFEHEQWQIEHEVSLVLLLRIENKKAMSNFARTIYRQR